MGLATTLLPFGKEPSCFSFNGDLIFFVYLFGLARFFMILAALDTGSSFEGMGASREAQFSVLAEIALMISLTALARFSSFSISGILTSITPALWARAAGVLALIAASMLIILLVENARIPFDDPNTHLELTMIHEVMVLDHSGPDLAVILYASALKFWTIGFLLIRVLLPVNTQILWLDQAISVAALFFLAVIVGVIESVMARLRLLNVPQLILGASTLSALALFLGAR
jgi:formate hydrogenlyase subunit 4